MLTILCLKHLKHFLISFLLITDSQSGKDAAPYPQLPPKPCPQLPPNHAHNYPQPCQQLPPTMPTTIPNYAHKQLQVQLQLQPQLQPPTMPKGLQMC